MRYGSLCQTISLHLDQIFQCQSISPVVFHVLSPEHAYGNGEDAEARAFSRWTRRVTWKVWWDGDFFSKLTPGFSVSLWFPYHPCMVYESLHLPHKWRSFVGKYTIHGWSGVGSPVPFICNHIQRSKLWRWLDGPTIYVSVVRCCFWCVCSCTSWDDDAIDSYVAL